MYLILFMIINLERKYCLIGYYGDDIIGDTVYNIRDIDLLMSLMYSLLSPGICFIRVHSTMHVPFVLHQFATVTPQVSATTGAGTEFNAGVE